MRRLRPTLIDTPSTAERDAAIRAAIGASNVVDLDAARARRHVRIASIAAAVLVVLGAAGLLVRALDNQHADKFQTVAGALSTTTSGVAPERGAPNAATTAGDAGGSSFTGRQPPLGSFDDRSSLVAAAQAQVHSLTFDQSKQAAPSTATSAVGGSGADGGSAPTTACPVTAPPDAANEVYAAAAVLQGRPVQVDVFTIADGSLTLVVTDAASCTELFSQSI